MQEGEVEKTEEVQLADAGIAYAETAAELDAGVGFCVDEGQFDQNLASWGDVFGPPVSHLLKFKHISNCLLDRLTFLEFTHILQTTCSPNDSGIALSLSARTSVPSLFSGKRTGLVTLSV